MEQYKKSNREMETRDHSKNGASLKSQMSRINIVIKISIAIFGIMFLFQGCKEKPTLTNAIKAIPLYDYERDEKIKNLITEYDYTIDWKSSKTLQLKKGESYDISFDARSQPKYTTYYILAYGDYEINIEKVIDGKPTNFGNYSNVISEIMYGNGIINTIRVTLVRALDEYSTNKIQVYVCIPSK